MDFNTLVECFDILTEFSFLTLRRFFTCNNTESYIPLLFTYNTIYLSYPFSLPFFSI